MSAFMRKFLLWYVAWFVIAVYFVHRAQDAELIDSIGIWYTIYCAAGFALPAAFVCAAFGKHIWSAFYLRR
jgi:hypothetical protein